jgi:hypothetical protein
LLFSLSFIIRSHAFQFSLFSSIYHTIFPKITPTHALLFCASLSTKISKQRKNIVSAQKRKIWGKLEGNVSSLMYLLQILHSNFVINMTIALFCPWIPMFSSSRPQLSILCVWHLAKFNSKDDVSICKFST